eukprot:NODE_886_length_3442_cov_0.414897.p3 type:complete len:145 gc:universal NODE_886_length_3442_cov_0.414897:954-1388(+)
MLFSFSSKFKFVLILQKRMKHQLQDIITSMKKKPGLHLTAFLLLHEATAVLAFPIVYPLASFSNRWLLQILPEKIIAKTDNSLKKVNVKVNKVRNYFGYSSLDDHHPVVLNFAMSYVFVKILMPVRLSLCLYITPAVVKLLSKK